MPQLGLGVSGLGLAFVGFKVGACQEQQLQVQLGTLPSHGFRLLHRFGVGRQATYLKCRQGDRFKLHRNKLLGR